MLAVDAWGGFARRVFAIVLLAVVALASGPEELHAIACIPCENNQDLGLLRLFIGTRWWVEGSNAATHWHYMVPQGERADVSPWLASAMIAWRPSDDSYLPKDEVGGDGTTGFHLFWVTQGSVGSKLKPDIGYDGDGGSGALAKTEDTPGADNLQFECTIISSDIFVAYDISKGNQSVYTYWWGDCPTGECFDAACWQNCTFDLPAVLTHEYGHALGFDDSNDATETMYGHMAPNAYGARRPTPGELTGAEADYRERYSPSPLDSFVVARRGDGTILCQWSCRYEGGWGSYRLSKSCGDGTSWVVSDSISCRGAGAIYEQLDLAPPCDGAEYQLSVLEPVVAGLQKRVILASGRPLSGVAPLVRRGRGTNAIASVTGQAIGYGSPEEAVRELGRAFTQNDYTQIDRALADGFLYWSADGSCSGRRIDTLLRRASLSCPMSAGLPADSIDLEPAYVTPLGTGRTLVVASVSYSRLGLGEVANLPVGEHFQCRYDPVHWTGSVRIMVEEVSPGDGWRVRWIDERP